MLTYLLYDVRFCPPHPHEPYICRNKQRTKINLYVHFELQVRNDATYWVLKKKGFKVKVGIFLTL